MDRKSSAIAGLALIPIGIAVLAEEAGAAGWIIFVAGWVLALAPVVIAFRRPRPPIPSMGPGPPSFIFALAVGAAAATTESPLLGACLGFCALLWFYARFWRQIV